MAESMVIGLELNNEAAVTAGLRRVAGAVDAIQARMSKSKSAGILIQVANISSIAISGGSVVINQRGGGGSTPSPRNPKSAPDFMQRLNRFFSSSRFSAGGADGGPSLMPLVGQALNLIGPEMAALAGPIGAAAAVIASLASAADTAAKAITAFRDSMITSGGSASEVSILNGIGKMAGVSDMAAAARQLADRIATDPAAAGFGHAAGIGDNNGAWSRLDKATALIKALDYIHSPGHSDEQAARFARVMNLEWAMKMRDATDFIYENAKKSAALISPVLNDPENRRNAANYDVEKARAGMAWEGFTERIGARLIPGLTSMFGMIANFFERVNAWMDRLSVWWDGLMGKTHEAHAAAVDANTAAVNANTAALRNGIFGGGERARGALPAAWGGMNAPNWTGEAIKLGAFAI